MRKLLRQEFLEYEGNLQNKYSRGNTLSRTLQPRKTLINTDPSVSRTYIEHKQLSVEKGIILKTMKTSIFVRDALMKKNRAMAMHDLKRKGHDSNKSQDEQAKRDALLNKMAARDAKLQRKLLIQRLNKDATRSEAFRIKMIKLMNSGRTENKGEILEAEEAKDDDEEKKDDESSEEEDIDDFLDREFDFEL